MKQCITLFLLMTLLNASISTKSEDQLCIKRDKSVRTKCEICTFGYLINSSCMEPIRTIRNCLQYFINSKCSMCFPGYTLDETGESCVECSVDNCARCSVDSNNSTVNI